MVWKRCEIYGDPYFYTFDGFGYEMRETGRFFIVKTDTEFEVCQNIYQRIKNNKYLSQDEISRGLEPTTSLLAVHHI